jgi:hypothetical protein
MDGKRRREEIEFLKREVSFQRALLVASVQRGESVTIPAEAIDVFRRIADHAEELGAIQVAEEWREFADACVRAGRVETKEGGEKS